MTGKLRILHTVENYHPSVSGMQTVVQSLSEYLVSQGHEVTVATSFDSGRNFNRHNGVEILQFKISGSFVHGYVGETETYVQFLLKGQFDVVVNFAAQQWATDLMLDILDKVNGKKVFVPTGFSGFYDSKYEVYFERMKDWIRQYDCIVGLSKTYRDSVFALQNGVKRFEVLPNGASKEEFETKGTGKFRNFLGLSAKTKIILLVGSHTGQKGHTEAIDSYVKSLSANTCLVILGNVYNPECYSACAKKAAYFNLFPFLDLQKRKSKILKAFLRSIFNLRIFSAYLQRKKIRVLEVPRAMTVEAFKDSDVFFFPSRVECSPIVLFESMAAALPFLTSDVGNSSEIIEWSAGAGLLLPTEHREGQSFIHVAASAELLDKVLRDPELRKKMGEQGRKAWTANFTWEKIGQQYEKLYRELVL